MVRRAPIVVLLAVLGLFALAPAAQARVSVVPGAVPGGGTPVFAFRLANERTDTTTTRLELTFPQDPPITVATVSGPKSWRADVKPRGENVGSIVLSGGSVGPRQFAQFLITLGPLPADGRLVLAAVQTFADGQTEASQPTVVIGPGNVVGAPAIGGPANPGPGLAPAEPAPGGISMPLLWITLAMAAAFVVLVGIRTRLLRDRSPDVEEPAEAKEPEAVAR